MGETRRKKVTPASKNIIAGSQKWRCATCNELLSPAFEVDHVIPLWQNGPDERFNMAAKCANCHALKTQTENIERRALEVQNERRKVKEAQRQWECDVRKKHRDAAMRRQTWSPDGTTKTCNECKERFYAIFRHDRCTVVEARIEAEISGQLRKPSKKRVDPSTKTDVIKHNEFYRFRYIAQDEASG